jgi:hypothetical protein
MLTILTAFWQLILFKISEHLEMHNKEDKFHYHFLYQQNIFEANRKAVKTANGVFVLQRKILHQTNYAKCG